MNLLAFALLSCVHGMALAATPPAARVRRRAPPPARIVTAPERLRLRLLPGEESPLASCALRSCGEKPPERLHFSLLGYCREKPEEMLLELTSHLTRDPLVNTAAEWVTTQRLRFDLRGSRFVVALRLPGL